jgi:alpha-ketoglutarate-dependent 2,4-dichlorophenoxyacetate dioxygenase
MQERFPESV